MRIQSEETKNISFLGRKRINQKDDLFQATLFKQSDESRTVSFFTKVKKYTTMFELIRKKSVVNLC